MITTIHARALLSMRFPPFTDIPITTRNYIPARAVVLYAVAGSREAIVARDSEYRLKQRSFPVEIIFCRCGYIPRWQENHIRDIAPKRSEIIFDIFDIQQCHQLRMKLFHLLPYAKGFHRLYITFTESHCCQLLPHVAALKSGWVSCAASIIYSDGLTITFSYSSAP